MIREQLPSPTTALPDHLRLLPLEIRKQLKRITSSPEFKGTASQQKFLCYVVKKTLAGQASEIKGYTVATEVFGRRDDFNQATDPIVSIQANKLRQALERYYLVAGQKDPIRIDIPKGTYVPVFHRLTPSKTEPPPQQDQSIEQVTIAAWPTILIQSFDNLTGNQQLEYIGIGIASEIALEITRYQEVRVLRHRPGESTLSPAEIGARFILHGSIKTDATGLKIIVELVDAVTGMLVWGDAYRKAFDPGSLISFEEKIAATIVSRILSECGVIAKALSPESRRIPPAELTTYQAMLHFYSFSNDFSPAEFATSFEALEQACVNEPECGLVWSMLARLYSLNYSLELFQLETPLEKAAAYAERGVKLDPANQRARTIMAFILLFKNELKAGMAEVEHALRLNPNSLVFLENIGYLLTLFGDWQRGPTIIRKTIVHNPYYNPSVHYALWANWIRQKEYEEAYRETLQFKRPLLFWDPLLKAASLGLLGKIEEGEQAAQELLQLKPDFHLNGNVLIQHYVKFDEIVERLHTGLVRVGIDCV